MIPIAEIFGPTIQGEGPDVGLKSIFVRVAGCDFHCSFCDSKFSWNVKNSISYEEKQLSKILIDRCNETNCSSIILTGGNPCLYNFSTIINDLRNNGIKIGVETQGSIFPSWIFNVDTLVISPKSSSDNQIDIFNNIKNCIYKNKFYGIVTIKIPIFNDFDFDFASKYYNEFKDILGPTFKFYLSVGNDNVTESGNISGRLLNSYEWLCNKVMESSMDLIYVLPQIHTLIWGNKQGV